MKYFEGAISYTEIEKMTIPEILELNKSAVRMEDDNKRKMNEEMQNSSTGPRRK